MSKLKLRKYITEGFSEHLRNNYGKYLAGAAAAGATGGVYAGGQGMLGDNIRDNVQDLGFKAAADLLGRGISNNTIENRLENPVQQQLGLAQLKLAKGISDFTNANESPYDVSSRNPEATNELSSKLLNAAGGDISYLVNRLHRALTPEN